MADKRSDVWFPEAGDGTADPVRKVQQAMASPLHKRFYAAVSVEAGKGGWCILLDGRMARTPARQVLALPNRGAAECVAAEWAAQDQVIVPATMPATRIAMSAIDTVGSHMQAVAAEIVKYAGSDLLCYRAGEPASLVARQAAPWDPVLAKAHAELGAPFILAEGVVFVEQPNASIAALQRAVAAYRSPFALAALHVMTTLTGSALLSLAVARGWIAAGAAWAAAHVDEDAQIAVWGEDGEAMSRRLLRERDFMAACSMLRLVGSA
jgi:chaperone required for assembly of F1-ATPase